MIKGHVQCNENVTDIRLKSEHSNYSELSCSNAWSRARNVQCMLNKISMLFT